MTDTAVDIILENLKQLVKSKPNLIFIEKDQIRYLHKELRFLSVFLKDSQEKEEQILEKRIRDAAYEGEFIVDLLVSSRSPGFQKDGYMGDIFYNDFDPCVMLSNLIGEMKYITAKVIEIFGTRIHTIEVLQIGKLYDGISSRSTNSVVEEESLVGFDNEALSIIERLLGTHHQRLDIISIVGMAGLGKTSLARKVYEDPLVEYHFYVRAWIHVSQEYVERDLLIGILTSGFQHEDIFNELSTEKLGEQLYKRLKGKKYLIVIDDLWNIAGWNFLKTFLPNDNTGSRVLVTSRLKAIALDAKPDSHPHSLKFLTADESWRLFKSKVFRGRRCPSELKEIGKKIAEKCGGLPLSIVVLAGLLAKLDKTLEWWKEVANKVTKYITNESYCIDILALSFYHLPHHLKSCYLYLGAFPKDHEIPVRTLTWLWISEGFIKQVHGKSLEDIAEAYLMDLVDRCLVIANKKRCNGGIKVCRIHDLLHDLCLREAPVTWHISGDDLVCYLSSFARIIVNGQYCNQLQISGFYKKPRLRSSFLCFTEMPPTALSPEKSSVFHDAFRRAKVLDLRSIYITNFPNDITELFQLRYLALRVRYANYLPPSISNLWNLETLIVVGILGDMTLPYDILKMSKLRHIYVRERIISTPHFSKQNYDGDAFILKNVQTISTIRLSSCEKEEVLTKTPNLRKLGGVFSLSSNGFNSFPNLNFLLHLETLNLTCNPSSPLGVKFAAMDNKFPSNMRKLTLSKSCLPWREMSTLGRLPNLEALKLLHNAFKGTTWETKSEEFKKLKFLKLQYMDVEQWETCSSHFPSLQQLLVHDCEQLEEIPSCVGDILTLEMIDLRWPTGSVADSARKILQEQQSMDNYGLKILIYPPKQEE